MNCVQQVTPIEDEGICYAQRLWQASLPADNSLVENYLNTRGIVAQPLNYIRYLPKLKHAPTNTYWPVMLAAVTDIYGNLHGLHRTYLAHDGKGKAPISPDKMIIGPVGGFACHLAVAGNVLAVSEGIETGLSVMQATGLPTWAALSAGGIQKLILPPFPFAQEVIICADNDANGVGQRAAVATAQRWLNEGRRVRIAMPPNVGKDFNDILKGV